MASKSVEYKKFRLRQLIDFAKYTLTLTIFASLIIWAPNQASEFTGYIGAFVLGGTKLRSILGS